MACVDFFYIVTNTVELKFHASSSILTISALLSKFIVTNKTKKIFYKRVLNYYCCKISIKRSCNFFH